MEKLNSHWLFNTKYITSERNYLHFFKAEGKKMIQNKVMKDRLCCV